MKQNKFRAWHKKEGAFVNWEGLLKMMDGLRIGIYKPINMATLSNRDSTLTVIEGNPFTHPDLEMEQFIGEKDRRGVEIYESDIVDYGFGADLVRFEGHRFEGVSHFHDCPGVIVGNLHENPSLLK